MIRRLARDQRGVAIVVAMGGLLVVSLLALVAANVAIQSNTATNRDTDSKRALSAADAGLTTANFRLGKADPKPDCLTGGNPTSPIGAYSCPMSATEDVGNGATYSYTVSPPLPAGDTTCVTIPGQTFPSYLKQRCITVVAQVNGTTRRVQARYVENRGAPIFPFVGLLGLDKVVFNQSGASGEVGSNGTVQIGPSATLVNPGTVKLGPSGNVQLVGTGNSWTSPPLYQGQPFTLDPLTQDYSDSVTTNNNASLPGGVVDGQRRASLGANQTVTLQSGAVYNFCSIFFANNGKLVVPATATEPVKIYVDSPNRPGTPNYTPSGCPSRAGASPSEVISVAAGAGFQNDTGRASMLQLYVYGGGPNQDIKFNGSAAFAGTLYAPQSKVTFASEATVTGAIAAKEIVFNNNSSGAGFTGDADAQNVDGGTDGTFIRKAWRECRASGC